MNHKAFIAMTTTAGKGSTPPVILSLAIVTEDGHELYIETDLKLLDVDQLDPQAKQAVDQFFLQGKDGIHVTARRDRVRLYSVAAPDRMDIPLRFFLNRFAKTVPYLDWNLMHDLLFNELFLSKGRPENLSQNNEIKALFRQYRTELPNDLYAFAAPKLHQKSDNPWTKLHKDTAIGKAHVLWACYRRLITPPVPVPVPVIGPNDPAPVPYSPTKNDQQ